MWLTLDLLFSHIDIVGAWSGRSWDLVHKCTEISVIVSRTVEQRTGSLGSAVGATIILHFLLQNCTRPSWVSYWVLCSWVHDRVSEVNCSWGASSVMLTLHWSASLCNFDGQGDFESPHYLCRSPFSMWSSSFPTCSHFLYSNLTKHFVCYNMEVFSNFVVPVYFTSDF